MPIQNHWGVYVDSEKPTTGVIHNGTAMYLSEEIDNAIDLDWEEHIKECTEYQENDYCECLDSDCSQHTYLIGFMLNEKTGKYEIDKNAEYSAIVNEIYTQIVHSKYALPCLMCSPCYPGQADLDSYDPDGQLAFCLPPSLFDPEYCNDFPIDKIREIMQMEIIPLPIFLSCNHAEDSEKHKEDYADLPTYYIKQGPSIGSVLCSECLMILALQALPA